MSKQMNNEKIINTIKRIFSKENIYLMGFIIIFGLIIYAELYIRDVINPDTASSGYSFYANSWDISLGRWGLLGITKLQFGLATPVLSTFVSLIIACVSTCFILDLFNIKRKMTKLIIGILLITLPAFSMTLTYFFCSDAYQLAMLLACMAAWFICKVQYKKVSFISSSICIIFLMSIYQSYIGVTAGLIVLYVLLNSLKILKEKTAFKQQIKLFVYSVFSVITGIILYGLISKIILYITNISVSGYLGTNDINIVNILNNFFTRISYVYINFFEYIFTDKVIYNSYYYREYLYGIVLIYIFVNVIAKGTKELINNKNDKIYIKIFEILFQVLLVAILPICGGLIYLIAINANWISVITTTGYFIFLILAIILISNSTVKIKKILLYFIISAIIYTYIISANASYICMNWIINKQVTIARNVLDEIQDIDEYNVDSKICFIGPANWNTEPKSKILTQKKVICSLAEKGYFWRELSQVNKPWQALFSRELGYIINIVDENQYYKLIHEKEVEEMPTYPQKGYIKKVDNIIVVKIK